LDRQDGANKKEIDKALFRKGICYATVSHKYGLSVVRLIYSTDYLHFLISDYAYTDLERLYYRVFKNWTDVNYREEEELSEILTFQRECNSWPGCIVSIIAVLISNTKIGKNVVSLHSSSGQLNEQQPNFIDKNYNRQTQFDHVCDAPAVRFDHFMQGKNAEHIMSQFQTDGVEVGPIASELNKRRRWDYAQTDSKNRRMRMSNDLLDIFDPRANIHSKTNISRMLMEKEFDESS